MRTASVTWEFHMLLSGSKRNVRVPFSQLLFLKHIYLKIINLQKQQICDTSKTPLLACICFPLKVALVIKNPTTNAEDIRNTGLIPGSGKAPGGGHGNPLQYSCLENPMDREAWWATVQMITKNWTQLKWWHAHTHTSLKILINSCKTSGMHIFLVVSYPWSSMW